MTMPTPRTKPSPSFMLWTGFFLVLITLAILTTYATLKGNQQLVALQAETTPTVPAPKNLMQLIIAGQPYYLEPETASVLSVQFAQKLEQQQATALAQFNQQLDSKLDDAFRPALNRIPYFANWYYSLQGEYTRLASALVGNMGEYLSNQLQEQVFSELDTRLEQSFQQLNQEASTLLKQNFTQLLQDMQHLIQQQGGGMPLANQTVTITQVTDFDALLGQVDLSQHTLGRQVASGLSAVGAFAAVTMGKGLGSAVVKQSLAKTVGTKSFQLAAALMTKTAVKTAAKSGGALEAGAVGIAICSPSGPIALLCGSGAAVITWLAVDKVFLEADEALNREAFENDIKTTLLEQREMVKQQLKTAYQQVLTAHYQHWLNPLQAKDSSGLPPPPNFVPAQMLQPQ